MINILPTAYDLLADSGTELISSTTSAVSRNVPIIGNSAMCFDSLTVSGRAGINFYCSPSPLAKVCFGISCVCGLVGATSSAIALATSFAGIPIGGWVGTFGARGFNRLGKYTLHMGNVTNGNITNVTAIADLMS